MELSPGGATAVLSQRERTHLALRDARAAGACELGMRRQDSPTKKNCLPPKVRAVQTPCRPHLSSIRLGEENHTSQMYVSGQKIYTQKLFLPMRNGITKYVRVTMLQECRSCGSRFCCGVQKCSAESENWTHRFSREPRPAGKSSHPHSRSTKRHKRGT